jgi:hypothetical protein
LHTLPVEKAQAAIRRLVNLLLAGLR